MIRELCWGMIVLVSLGFVVRAADPYGDISDLKIAKPADKEDAKSVPPPKDAVVLFDGKSLDNWIGRDGKAPQWKLLDGGIMQADKLDIATKEKFDGKFKLHVEFRVPYMPDKKGQERANSGVYVQGRYEVQVLDSYGIDKPKNNDCGAIYEVAAPLVNACKAPTIWQTYDIEFTAPKCVDGKKTEPAVISVLQNGVKVQDNTKITSDNTRAGMGGDVCAPGPIMLQFHGNPVQFRNVWLVKDAVLFDGKKPEKN
jgi:hypothetical protein